ncbi:MAG: hypothetical protein VR64_12725 [Desulfatitalea sp. BRH_c12]|nr:MAG: hypothetical protein VR64_12725 [Desulfatitalea sp. BRH_c12]
MKCEKCGANIAVGDDRQHAGQILCEDCYMAVMAAPKTCDPWATYSAKNTAAQGLELTVDQRKIIDLIKSEGPLRKEQICSALGIGEDAFQSDFATLRHLELARACKVDDQVHYTLFG